ncbi:heme-binding-like protein At3g10130, chloroplastic [Tripterygium wilfordii]|uniref:heme-binding-like protein At3g10130, chloroplastic n=1 Tax=Tripterygium wilfordii TaxID=458696 RepID=UPI0018F8064E|nr:heme-binding-like protein At3g10130, chloroplastic [Tripterygium wilfordii]XP_038721673.1 heme-binding-like protein At3g10130, chloroplastic [Tripterygium wilfordii]
MDVVSETAKYVFPKRFENRNLEDALMAGVILLRFCIVFWFLLQSLAFLVSGARVFIGFVHVSLFHAVPELGTVEDKVVSRKDEYEIRAIEPCYIVETTMPGTTGFNFNGASESFNVLAEYLFGKNKRENGDDYGLPQFYSEDSI